MERSFAFAWRKQLSQTVAVRNVEKHRLPPAKSEASFMLRCADRRERRSQCKSCLSRSTALRKRQCVSEEGPAARSSLARFTLRIREGILCHENTFFYVLTPPELRPSARSRCSLSTPRLHHAVRARSAPHLPLRRSPDVTQLLQHEPHRVGVRESSVLRALFHPIWPRPTSVTVSPMYVTQTFIVQTRHRLCYRHLQNTSALHRDLPS